MKISARNMLAGRISKVTKGAVNSEIELTLAGGEQIIAVITNESVAHLGLKAGDSAYAIVKATWVILGQGIDAKKISTRNVLRGTVAKVIVGAVNDEVVLRLTGGSELTAVITRESGNSLHFKEGDQADAAFKANNVIIAVD